MGRSGAPPPSNGNLVQFDPKTGAPQIYAVLTIVAGSSTSGIYGLAVGVASDPWFTDVGDNAIGRLQPATGHFTFYPIPAASSGPFGLVIDHSGRVWFTARVAFFLLNHPSGIVRARKKIPLQFGCKAARNRWGDTSW